MVRMIMHGCNGKMGQVITGICKEDENIEIVAGIDPYTGLKNDYPVFAKIGECNVEADVIVDFAAAPAVDDLLAYSIEKQIPVVLCTTGLTEGQLQKVEETSKKVAVLKSANMSLGINMLMDLLQKAAKILSPAGFDMEIVEKQALDNAYNYKYDRSQERKKRDKYEIGIQAVRGGNIVGEHEVIFAGTDEVIEFKHTAYSKAVFAKGAVEAAKFLAGKPAGRYEMSDVIAAR